MLRDNPTLRLRSLYLEMCHGSILPLGKEGIDKCYCIYALT